MEKYHHLLKAFTFFNLDTSPARPEKVWITKKEIYAWTRLAGLIILNEKQESVSIYSKRVIELVERNGWKFAFNYLKECFRIVTHLQAGHPVVQDYSQGLRIKVDSFGYPKILPATWRREARDSGVWVRFILTTLQIFRVFPYHPPVKLDSIIDPFSGITKRLPDDLIIRVGKALKFKPNKAQIKVKPFISEKAGPNFKKATHGSFLDALAFWRYPDKLFSLLRWIRFFEGYNFLFGLSLITIMILGIPLILVYSLLGLTLRLGKLSVVYDQAGKSRVVAIANYWTQCCLKPLHDYIFSWQKTLDTDGTFDQHGSIDRFLDRVPPGSTFHSIDLTAATDRIPVECLAQILENFGFRGKLWADMLDLVWFYKDKPVQYSVGQGMGAYSSWAMLAVFNHFLVRIAAQRSGLKESFNLYVVQGDDVVIAHDEVARQYRLQLEALGVKVSEGKCLTSSKLLEFAKQLRGPEGNMSPLGAGLILNFLRYRQNVYPLLLEMYRLNYLDFKAPARDFLSRFTSLREGEIRQILAAAFNPGSNLASKGHGSLADVLFDGVQTRSLILSLYTGQLTEIGDISREGVSRSREMDTYFHHNWWSLVPISGVAAQSPYERQLYLVSPAFWAYTLYFMRGIEEADKQYEVFRSYSRNPSMGDLETLFRSGVLPVISGKSSRESRISLKRVSRVFRYSFIDKRAQEARLNFSSAKRKPVVFDSTDWI